MQPLDAPPASFPAGTTVDMLRSHADYRASDGWALTFLLAGPSVASANGVAEGDGFRITLDAATTAALAPGRYHWTERAAKAGDVYEAAGGTLVVEPNLATATAGSLQSSNEKFLALVELRLEGRITDDMESYQVGGRALTRVPLSELMTLRAKLRAAVARERGGGRLGRLHQLHFRGAGG